MLEEGDPLEGIPDKYIRDCPDCQTGQVRKPGDAHARDRVLEVSGLITRGKGIQVNLNQNFAGQSHSSAVTELDNAMSIVEGTSSPVDQNEEL